MRVNEILKEWESSTSSSWENTRSTSDLSQSGGSTQSSRSVDNPGRADYLAKKRDIEQRAEADNEARRQQYLQSKGLQNATSRERLTAIRNAKRSGEFTDTTPDYSSLGQDPGSHTEITRTDVPAVNTRVTTSTSTINPPTTKVTPTKKGRSADAWLDTDNNDPWLQSGKDDW